MLAFFEALLGLADLIYWIGELFSSPGRRRVLKWILVFAVLVSIFLLIRWAM